MGRRTVNTPKRKSNRKSLFVRLVFLVWTVITGGSVTAWFVPDLPVLGPLMHRVVGAGESGERQAGPVDERSAAQVVRQKLANANASAKKTASVPPVGGQLAASPALAVKPQGTILIASFNIQVFGTSKMAKAWVVDVLAQVVRQFDVVAVQEIRSVDDRILPEFVAKVNEDGSRYHFVIGPRLGRTVSKEQYAFIYDTSRVEIDSSSIASMEDPRDMLHREPFVARFRARTQLPDRAFSFWLVNIHTDPDEVDAEVDVLADVFQVVQNARQDEDDVILLGDLNASERQFGRLGQLPGMAWAVSGEPTNTRGTKTYDNLLFVRSSTVEYTGRWGVLDLQSSFGLTLEQALEVSDHLPVWAEFSVWEGSSGNNAASLPTGRRR